MRLAVLALLALLVGCSTTTVVTMEDGRQVTVKAGRYELVEFTRNGEPFKVDKRGRPGIIEQIAALWGASGIRKEDMVK